MLGILAPISRLIKVKDIDIYDNVFRMHSKLTVMLFLAFSALVSAHEFFGKPMDCVGSDMRQVDPYFNNYCWINGTYTLSLPKNGEHLIYIIIVFKELKYMCCMCVCVCVKRNNCNW